MRYPIVIPALLVASSFAFADSNDDFRKIIKDQAGQQMEKELGLPQTAPSNAKAYILSPADGAEVTSPVKVVFGLSGMGVAPAGVNKPETGHFHLLIDDPKFEYAQPLPSSAQIVHYGNGQIEASVELKPGKHTLQLLLADWKHQPHNPAVRSDQITVTVK
jgi:hypothetical protein